MVEQTHTAVVGGLDGKIIHLNSLARDFIISGFMVKDRFIGKRSGMDERFYRRDG